MSDRRLSYLPMSPTSVTLTCMNIARPMDFFFDGTSQGCLPNIGVGCSLASVVAGVKDGKQAALVEQRNSGELFCGSSDDRSPCSMQGQVMSFLTSVVAKPESIWTEEEKATMSLIQKYIVARNPPVLKHEGSTSSTRTGSNSAEQTLPEQQDAAKMTAGAEPPHAATATQKEQKNRKERQRYAAKKGTLVDILAKPPSERTPEEQAALARDSEKKSKNSLNDSRRYAAKKAFLRKILAKAPGDRTPEEERHLRSALARKKQKSKIDAWWIARRRAAERARWANQRARMGMGEPRDHDVLLGKGREQHPGNRRYRRIVEEGKARYLAASSAERGALARDVVRRLKELDPPGRFLELDAATKLWFDVGDEKAEAKVCRALSRKTADMKKKLSTVDKETKQEPTPTPTHPPWGTTVDRDPRAGLLASSRSRAATSESTLFRPKSCGTEVVKDGLFVRKRKTTPPVCHLIDTGAPQRQQGMLRATSAPCKVKASSGTLFWRTVTNDVPPLGEKRGALATHEENMSSILSSQRRPCPLPMASPLEEIDIASTLVSMRRLRG